MQARSANGNSGRTGHRSRISQLFCGIHPTVTTRLLNVRQFRGKPPRTKVHLFDVINRLNLTVKARAARVLCVRRKNFGPHTVDSVRSTDVTWILKYLLPSAIKVWPQETRSLSAFKWFGRCTFGLAHIWKLIQVGTKFRCIKGNSLDKLGHTTSVAHSAEQVLMNKQHIWCGGAHPDCYQI